LAIWQVAIGPERLKNRLIFTVAMARRAKKDRLGFKAEPVWGFSLTIRWRIVGW
jgi:hypothetical protein